jgi:2-(1,2-epoxy-1,2-dihydrophenyl)acetyl-CoA isomerase
MTTLASEPVLFELRDGIARITLNRPDAANAIAPEQRDTLIALFERCDTDHDVRAVLLRSSGKHFCAGADLGRILSNRTTVEKHVGDDMGRIMSGALQLIAGVLDCRKPVVCAVQGVAGGLGLHLALACDLIVAARSASFFEPLVLRGLVVDGAGAYLLPRRIGMQRAKEMSFLGDRVPADEAFALGLVNRVAEPDELDATAEALAARLAQGATSAISLTKRLLNQSLDAGREQAFLMEAMAVEMQSKAQDVTEGVTAFREHRDAKFVGH